MSRRYRLPERRHGPRRRRGVVAAGTWIGGDHGWAIAALSGYAVLAAGAFAWAGRSGDVAAILRAGEMSANVASIAATRPSPGWPYRSRLPRAPSENGPNRDPRGVRAVLRRWRGGLRSQPCLSCANADNFAPWPHSCTPA
jgi:hypothetical protein